MPIYKIKEQIMRNLLFTFPKHIFTEHLYITYDIYRYKQYIINIKIIKVLITITATAMMLVINNNNTNNNNYIQKKRTEKGKKSHVKKLHESLAHFNVCFLDIHRNLTIARIRKKIL